MCFFPCASSLGTTNAIFKMDSSHLRYRHSRGGRCVCLSSGIPFASPFIRPSSSCFPFFSKWLRRVVPFCFVFRPYFGCELCLVVVMYMCSPLFRLPASALRSIRKQAQTFRMALYRSCGNCSFAFITNWLHLAPNGPPRAQVLRMQCCRWTPREVAIAMSALRLSVVRRSLSTCLHSSFPFLLSFRF